MARYTGKGGSAIINSLTWILTEWDYEEDNDPIVMRAMGDVATERAAGFKDWKVEMRGYLSTTEPLANTAIPNGTEIAVNLRFLAASTNPFFTDTGLCTRGRINTPHDGPVTLEATVVSSDGSAMGTFDTTP